MSIRKSEVTDVDVGEAPSNFPKWDTVRVRYHGFADLPIERGDKAMSPEFSCVGHRWILYVYPGGDIFSNQGYVSVQLMHESDEEITVEFSISAIGPALRQVAYWGWDQDDLEDGVFTFLPRGAQYHEHFDFTFKSNYSKRTKLMQNANVNGALILEVRMRKLSPSDETPPTDDAFVPVNPLCQNILRKFMDEESADVKFEVRGRTAEGGRARKKSKTAVVFFAHSTILEFCAPMLAEMCKSGGMQDASTNRMTVPIDGVDPPIFRHLLYYIYGGKIPDDALEAHSREFIDAADKFDVVNLKLEAEAFYVRSTAFSAGNILDNLLYAESKNCAFLKEAAMEFLVENGQDIVGRVSFENVPGSMMTDLLTAVARGKRDGDGGGDSNDYNTMRVGTLRKILRERGLDVDGSREAMISRLEENS